MVIGIAPPVPSLKFRAERVRFLSEEFGLTVLGQEDNATDERWVGRRR